MIEANFQQRGQRRIRGNMAADARIFLVLAMHHRHGIPAHQALDSPLESAVTGVRLFFIRRDGVDVGRVELNGKVHARLLGATRQGFKQLASAAGALLFYDLVKGLNPLGKLLVVRFQLRDWFCIHSSNSMPRTWRSALLLPEFRRGRAACPLSFRTVDFPLWRSLPPTRG